MKKKFTRRLMALACTLTMMVTAVQPALAATASFTDVPATHWASSYIQKAVEEGFVAGYPDGGFHPDAEVTYAQFITMTARALYVIPEEYSSTPWYKIYMDALNQDNLLAGTAAESSTNASINRYEMAQIMGNVMKEYGAQSDASQIQNARNTFTDWSSVPQKYQEAVALCLTANVLSGLPNGSFGGSQTMTRAQACTVLTRVLALMDGEPTSPSTNPAEECAEVIRLINAERSKAGLKPLSTLDSLTKAAQMRADDLSKGYFDNRPDGSDWDSVFNTAGVSSAVSIEYIDESVAGGAATAAQVLNMLKNTDGPREAMVHSGYEYIGVGYTHTDKPAFEGYSDFWSILYVQPEKADSSQTQQPSASFTPVPIDQLANRKSLQNKASDDQLAQAYAEALKIVTPLSGLSTEQQLQGIATALRARFDAGMTYSMESAHYSDPYGYLIEGSASCAGCTRATGLCLNILGIPYEHVNENQYSHQWCRVNINGTYWICDAYGLYVGPEPAPYKHPYF